MKIDEIVQVGILSEKKSYKDRTWRVDFDRKTPMNKFGRYLRGMKKNPGKVMS